MMNKNVQKLLIIQSKHVHVELLIKQFEEFAFDDVQEYLITKQQKFVLSQITLFEIQIMPTNNLIELYFFL